MPKLNQRGVIAQFVMLLVLGAGIAAGVYLVRSGNLKLFSKATINQTRIEFLDSKGEPITATTSQQVKLKLTYVASSASDFSVGTNVTGITHYGYRDNSPYCVANAAYAVGESTSLPPTGGAAGANLYVDPPYIAPSGAATVIATSETSCSMNIQPAFGAGLENCKGGCGLGGVSDGCTCSGGNPKDTKPCWWRWTCTAATPGSYTASFNTIFFDIPASDADAALAEMQRMGMKVIRVFVANKNISDNEAAKRLSDFLTKAASYKISVIASLIGFYGDNGFYPQGAASYYTDMWNGIPLLNHDFFAKGYKDGYLPFVKTVVSYNKDHSNIYAWEPGNELKDDSSPSTFIAFMKDVTSVIKSIDPTHDIATGMLNAAHTRSTPDQLYPELPNVDIITIRDYNGDRSSIPDAEWAIANNKKVLLEEVGFSGTGDRSASIKTELDYWRAKGVSAALQWGFVAKGLPDNGNGDGDSGMDTFRHSDYAALAALYQNYNTQTIKSFPTHFKVANSVSELDGAPEQIFDKNGKIIDWTLPSGGGMKTVYATFKVNDQWQNPIYASIAFKGYSGKFVLYFGSTDIPTRQALESKYKLTWIGHAGLSLGMTVGAARAQGYFNNSYWPGYSIYNGDPSVVNNADLIKYSQPPELVGHPERLVLYWGSVPKETRMLLEKKYNLLWINHAGLPAGTTLDGAKAAGVISISKTYWPGYSIYKGDRSVLSKPDLLPYSRPSEVIAPVPIPTPTLIPYGGTGGSNGSPSGGMSKLNP